MNAASRTTVYLEPELYEAMRLRAAVGNRSVSKLINEAVRAFLAEDLADKVACTERLDAVYGAPGVHTSLDPVLADLQFTTLARHADR
jgi:hypothetical protein